MTTEAASTNLVTRPAWSGLKTHAATLRQKTLRELFAGDPQRGRRFSLDAVGIYFDYSKHRLTEETLRLLLKLAQESGVTRRRDAMFSGENINITEQRAVLHVALRTPRGKS